MIDPLSRVRTALACLDLALTALPDAPTAATLSTTTARTELAAALEQLGGFTRTPRLGHALTILRDVADLADTERARRRILVALAYLQADPLVTAKLEDLEQLEQRTGKAS